MTDLKNPEEQKVLFNKLGAGFDKMVGTGRMIYFIILMLAVVVTAAFAWWPKNTALQKTVPRSQFALCLATKQVAMYGSDSCEACLRQKGMFEQDFNRIQYINCDIDQEECTQKGIQQWPTWMYNDQAFVGVQSFQDLAKISGCVAPAANE